jgi:hypothetical protein
LEADVAKVHKVMLTGEQFRLLVRGEILKIMVGPIGQTDTVELALTDVGFEIMRHYVQEAENDAKNPPLAEVR